MVARVVTRHDSVPSLLQVSSNNLPEKKGDSETTVASKNKCATNLKQIWSPAKKTMITIPDYDSDPVAYSLAMKGLVLDDRQLYNLARGKLVDGIDTTRIDLSDLTGKKALSLPGIHSMRGDWISQLEGHIASRPAS